MGYIDTSIKFKEIEDSGNAEGKNSTNFIAIDTQLDTRLFMKKISKESLDKQGIRMEDYFLEARLLYKGKHNNVAEIQYASEDNDFIYLAMPEYPNGSLSSLMDNKYLTVREIIKYSLDFLSGLAYIHSKRMIHLDIKPTNVLIDNTGKAILTDFGLSRLLSEGGTIEQGMNYVYIRDPQSYQTNKRSIESDIYQVGTLLYRMCNGNDVLDKQIGVLGINNLEELKENILSGEFPIRKTYMVHIPIKLQKIVEKCLEIDIDKRYNNVISIMNDLSDIENNLDWEYLPDEEFVYSKTEKSRKIKIKIETSSDKYNILCISEGLEGQNRKRISKHCGTNITEKEINKKIKNIFKDIN